MSLNILNDKLDENDINYILELPEVLEAKKNIENKKNGSVCFFISLTPTIKKNIIEKLGLILDKIPMRWIKGDTLPHIDVGSKQFNKTYLAYLTDSPGKFLIENNSYPIVKGNVFIFNEGLKHETINTGLEPRLLLGPMSENGLAVGSPGHFSGGQIVYIRQSNPPYGNIEYSTDQSNWNNIVFPFNLYNETTINGFVKIYFITDITLNGTSDFFGINTDYIQIGSETLNNDGTRPTITITASDYDGFITNGLSATNGYNNISIYNLIINGTGGTQQIGAGWLGKKYFGKGSNNNYIINCSSSGQIGTISGAGGGGILGDYAENVTLIGCSSSGIIYTNAGGIIGTDTSGNIIQSCWSTGAINGDGAGGIVGTNCTNAAITNCYSEGNISGNNSGGIIGSNPGSSIAIIQNCYSRGEISGPNSGGICGSLGVGTFNVTIQNCYTAGTLSSGSSNQAGGICGFIFNGNTTISYCYTSGNATGSTGYIVGGENAVNGTGPKYILSNNYSETNSGGTGWSNNNANNTLQQTPGSYSSSSVWQTIFGAPNPYELFNMGYTPYSTTNISGNNLVRTASATVNAGNSTNSAIKTNGPYYTFLEDYSTLYQINIDNATGIISTTSSTPVGVYTLYVYNTGSYNITTYTLTVTLSPGPTPTPTPSVDKLNFPVQRVSLNQKSCFCGTKAVSSTAVGIGALRGKGSATRIFNNCKGNNGVNFKLCQFRVLGFK